LTVCVEDDTTAGIPPDVTGETVTLTTTGTGLFEGTASTTFNATLDGSGCCTVTYTPGAFEAGVTTLTATFGTGSAVYNESPTSELLTVELRPTVTTVTGSSDTLLVNEPYNYTASVDEADGIPGSATSPLGTLAYSTYLETHGGDATVVPAVGVAPTGAFVYTCTGLDAEAGIDTIYADYTAADGIHADSSGLFGQGIQRRPTETFLNCSSTAGGCSCTATAAEDPDNPGTDVALTGDLAIKYPSDTADLVPATAMPCTVWPTAGCVFSVITTSPLANVTVQYEPTDRVHLASSVSVNVDRSDQFDPSGGGDGTTGANCTDGCGAGGVDIAQMIYDLNAADVALAAVQMGLEVAAIAVDLIPDGVVTGGLIVQTGVTIPYSDIAAAIIAGSGVAIEIARTAMESLTTSSLPMAATAAPARTATSTTTTRTTTGSRTAASTSCSGPAPTSRRRTATTGS
jgi:hypothetical protein